MADYLQAHTEHARMMETLHRREAEAQRRSEERTADRRAIMTRLPTDPHPATGNTMLTDLRALHSAFGTRAAWIAVDGETLLGTEPDRSRRVVPVRQHSASGGEA